MATVNFTGTWKHVRDEHFDDFLKANEVNFVTRKMATSVSPIQEIKHDGDSFYIILKTPISNKGQEINFDVGTDFKASAFVGGAFTGSPSWDGDKLVIRQVHENPEKVTYITREIIDNELVMTMQLGDVTAKRFFRKA